MKQASIDAFVALPFDAFVGRSCRFCEVTGSMVPHSSLPFSTFKGADFLQTGLTQGLAPNVEVIVFFGYLGRFDSDRLAMPIKASQPVRPPGSLPGRRPASAVGRT